MGWRMRGHNAGAGTAAAPAGNQLVLRESFFGDDGEVAPDLLLGKLPTPRAAAPNAGMQQLPERLGGG
jgi:hypothetical protein